jgi:hypothetical protein
MDIIGHKFLVDFGMAKAILNIQSEILLVFTITEQDKKNVNISESVTIKITQLRPLLYLLTWKEMSGNTIVQIQDHENRLVYMNWTQPGGEFINTTGSIREI